MNIANLVGENSIWLPILIFLARVADVSLGTVRLIAVTRGHRLMAVVLGFFELIIWVFAVSSVFMHLDRWVNILAFAGGFSTGNALGMWLESRLALGMQTLNFTSRGTAHAVAERLRYADLTVTTLSGNGRDGPVALCTAVVPRKRMKEVVKMARSVDPNVFVTVQDVQESALGPSAHVGAGKIPMMLLHDTWLKRRKQPVPPPTAPPGPPAPDPRPTEPQPGASAGASGNIRSS